MAGVRFVVAVTGAQGVGKSTFCMHLEQALKERFGQNITLLAGLGDSIRRRDLPVGASGSSDTIAAVFAGHLARELETPEGIVILDRCLVDALAYVRCLRKSTATETELYEQITRTAVRSIDLVVNLNIAPTFEKSEATHETPELRHQVNVEIPKIIGDLALPTIAGDASDVKFITAVISRVQQIRSAAFDTCN